MANLKEVMSGGDPTLQAADRALEARESAKPYRSQKLGMSQIGDDCQRYQWYIFRWAFKENFTHESIKRFEDGYHVEDLIAQRLAMVAGVNIVTKDPATGKQFVYLDCDGHAKGKCDGKITGILQAPKKLHIFEAKACQEKKLNELRKLKLELGEKAALKKWNEVYYAQAQLYMHYEGTDRHYLVVGSPGLRDWDSCRTELDPAYVMQLRAKMNRTIASNEPLTRVSDKPDWWKCKTCPAKGICHEKEMPDRNCRTCLHSTPTAGGKWHCERWGNPDLTPEMQAQGCPAHKFLPTLVPGEVVEAGDNFVRYRLPDGSEWIDAEGELPQ